MLESLLQFVSQWGYLAMVFLLAAGIVGLPIPDETLLVFSGALAAKGRLDPGLTYLSGFLGAAGGITVSYFLGRTAGPSVIAKWGPWLHFTPERFERVQKWFTTRGNWLLTIGYFVPGVRHFTALVAGMANLRYPVFAAFAYLGAAIWVATFVTIGRVVGENWQAVVSTLERRIGLVAVVLVIFLLLAFWLTQRRR